MGQAVQVVAADRQATSFRPVRAVQLARQARVEFRVAAVPQVHGDHEALPGLPAHEDIATLRKVDTTGRDFDSEIFRLVGSGQIVTKWE